MTVSAINSHRPAPAITSREAFLRRAEVALMGEVAQAKADQEFGTEKDAETALTIVRRLIGKARERGDAGDRP